jgi:hypothetical protein
MDDDNPYRSPLTVDSRPRIERAEPKAPRPIGLALLSVFQTLLGISSLIVFFKVANGTVSVALIPALIMTLGHGVVSTSSGIGMWLGIRWGWWLATLHSVYLIVRDGAGVTNSALFADRGSVPDMVGVVVVQFLLLLWLLRPNVLEFCALKQLNKPTAVAVLTGISLALLVFGAAIEDVVQ